MPALMCWSYWDSLQQTSMPSDVAARVTLLHRVCSLGQASGEESVTVDRPPPLSDDAGVRGGLLRLLMSLAAWAGKELAHGDGPGSTRRAD